VVRMGERENCTRFWLESQEERGHSEDQVVDGRIGSEWILGRLVEGGVASCCECDYEPSDSCGMELLI
jgi:hypothetical protein